MTGPIKRAVKRIPDGGSTRDIEASEDEYREADERWKNEMTEAMNALLSQHPKVMDEFIQRLEGAKRRSPR